MRCAAAAFSASAGGASSNRVGAATAAAAAFNTAAAKAYPTGALGAFGGPELCRDQPGSWGAFGLQGICPRGKMRGAICVAGAVQSGQKDDQLAASARVVPVPRTIAAEMGPGHLRVARHARGL